MDGYVAFIHPAENGSAWGVSFPDVPGCISAGDSFEEALANGREALSGHLAVLAAEGDPIPVPRRVEDVVNDPEFAEDRQGAVVSMIVPRKVSAPRRRVNIVIDPGLLRRADEAADARGLTRSGFIEQALEVLIERDSASPPAKGARRPKARPTGMTAGDRADPGRKRA
jgi:predicted RNase H-like HicB family nuclease